MRSHSQNKSTSYDASNSKKRVRTGTLTTYWKLAAFLRYAAAQPEPMIGRSDDDVLISPWMLIAHTQWLVARATYSPYLYAGAFEWYSWRTATLMSTGFGLSAGAARKKMRSAWRNCSATGERVGKYGGDTKDPCVGPVAFAKGPLMLLSAAAVRAVVSGGAFERDVRRAEDLLAGRAQAYNGPGSGRIDDDVQLGYWLSLLPKLQVVTFRRYLAWHDRWKAGVAAMLPRLLLAHKVPWSQYGEMLNRTAGLWRGATTAQARLLCQGPPCENCAHTPTQLACVVTSRCRRPPARSRQRRAGPSARSPRGRCPTCRGRAGFSRDRAAQVDRILQAEEGKLVRKSSQ